MKSIYIIIAAVIALDSFLIFRKDKQNELGNPCSTIQSDFPIPFKDYAANFSSYCVLLPKRNVSLHVLDNQNKQATETNVFSHGLLTSTFMWQHQLKFFNDKNYRVIAFDHRGQGLSETPIGSELITPEDNYLDTVELLETLQLGKVHFIGLAMGGFVGMRLGARNSHLLKSLVLMATDSFQDVNSRSLQNEIFAFILTYFGPQTFISESLWPAFFDKEYIEKNLQLWVDFDKFNLKNNIYRTVRGIWQRAEFKELNKIQNLPVIVIHGENDVIPISSAYLVNNIKDAQFLPISNAGHFTPIEKPTEINQSILKFVKAV